MGSGLGGLGTLVFTLLVRVHTHIYVCGSRSGFGPWAALNATHPGLSETLYKTFPGSLSSCMNVYLIHVCMRAQK